MKLSAKEIREKIKAGKLFWVETKNDRNVVLREAASLEKPYLTSKSYSFSGFDCFPKPKIRRRKALAVALAILFLTCSLHAADYWSALSQLESGDKDNATGRSHEVSRYQMLPSVWRSATSLPLSAATNRDVAWSVASKVQGARVVAFARREGRIPTAGEWILLWHCPSRVLRPNAEEKIYEQRFLNLVNAK